MALNIKSFTDGFLRSAGLGADLIQPQSWVIDERGIYYDSSRVSGLENILQTITLNKGMKILQRLIIFIFLILLTI